MKNSFVVPKKKFIVRHFSRGIIFELINFPSLEKYYYGNIILIHMLHFEFFTP